MGQVARRPGPESGEVAGGLCLVLVPGFWLLLCSSDLLSALSYWACHASLQSPSNQATYIQQARLGGVA